MKRRNVNTRVVGDVVMASPKAVTNNQWNPNRMTDRKYESLVRGLKEDGWLKSHALTIWGSDEHGEVKNIIIDGEHRWRAGSALGFSEVPMVFVHGMTESDAKKLTIKLDNTGDFDHDGLVELILDVRSGDDDLALEMGFTDDEFDDLLAPFDNPVSVPQLPNSPETQSEQVATVKLFFGAADHACFIELVESLGERWGSCNASDTVLRALGVASADTNGTDIQQ